MRLIALSLLFLSGCMTPMEFSPKTAPDGTKTWTFVSSPTLAKDESALNTVISAKIGESHWCSNGWDTTSKQIANGFLVVEGRCR